MICLGMHSNVMLRFMVQAFMDPPLSSSTDANLLEQEETKTALDPKWFWPGRRTRLEGAQAAPWWDQQDSH